MRGECQLKFIWRCVSTRAVATDRARQIVKSVHEVLKSYSDPVATAFGTDTHHLGTYVNPKIDPCATPIKKADDGAEHFDRLQMMLGHHQHNSSN